MAETHRIVVGVDGSEASKEALRWAARFAASIGGTIEAIIAWHPPANYGWGYLPGDWDPSQDAEKALIDTVDAVFGANRPEGMTLLVSEGNPAKVLIDRSQGAELLVVGSRGHGGFVGLLIGSVSEHCAEHAKCPVLVVHGEHDTPPRS